MRAAAALGLALVLFPVAASARCLAYEPSVVHLVGELSSRKVPGPPNYTSIARGDYPEIVHVVALEKPICVSRDPSSRANAKSHFGVKEVQLAVSKAEVRFLIGKRVRASGTLFGAQTGHHRTPVVLQVSKIRGL